MNYRHAFHAGNFADVMKHVFLSRILEYMKRKDAPLRFIDTHAGIGKYDLSGDEANRTEEWRDGIARLLDHIPPASIEHLLHPYLNTVRECFSGANRSNESKNYPGSPALAQSLLRRQDRMIFCELHPADRRKLTRNCGRDKRVKVVEIDGYTALRAYVPPVERRGLVLIDPPFEAIDEFTNLSRNLVTAWKKWPTGVYAIWYPVKDPRAIDRFYETLTNGDIGDVLRLELNVRQVEADKGLAGSGMAIINPPYVLEGEAQAILPLLCSALGQNAHAGYRVEQFSTDRR